LLAPKERVMTLLTYEEAEKLNKLAPDMRSAKIGAGATCLEDFQNAGRKAPIEELLECSATIESAIREMGLYYETLKGLTPVALEVSGIEETIGKYSNRFGQLTKSRIASERQTAGSETALSADSDQASPGSQRTVSTLNKQVMTRDDALEGLLKVADFFRRTEPHSPVSYALEQAVRWGRMPLPKLLEDLVSDSGVREEMFRRLGIQNPNDDSYSDNQNSEDDR